MLLKGRLNISSSTMVHQVHVPLVARLQRRPHAREEAVLGDRALVEAVLAAVPVAVGEAELEALALRADVQPRRIDGRDGRQHLRQAAVRPALVQEVLAPALQTVRRLNVPHCRS